MKKKRLFLVFTALVVLIAATTLTRCGSSSGDSYAASLNGTKF